jgi:hypothetical protein
MQINPQITDGTGKYSFLVPEGTYYLTAAAQGYYDYKSDPFDVVAEVGVHKNLELKKQMSWKDYLSWQNILIVLLVLAVGYIIYQNVLTRKMIIKNQIKN